jgi:hypothetical protein
MTNRQGPSRTFQDIMNEVVVHRSTRWPTRIEHEAWIRFALKKAPRIISRQSCMSRIASTSLLMAAKHAVDIREESLYVRLREDAVRKDSGGRIIDHRIHHLKSTTVVNKSRQNASFLYEIGVHHPWVKSLCALVFCLQEMYDNFPSLRGTLSFSPCVRRILEDLEMDELFTLYTLKDALIHYDSCKSLVDFFTDENEYNKIYELVSAINDRVCVCVKWSKQNSKNNNKENRRNKTTSRMH